MSAGLEGQSQRSNAVCDWVAVMCVSVESTAEASMNAQKQIINLVAGEGEHKRSQSGRTNQEVFIY